MADLFCFISVWACAILDLMWALSVCCLLVTTLAGRTAAPGHSDMGGDVFIDQNNTWPSPTSTSKQGYWHSVGNHRFAITISPSYFASILADLEPSSSMTSNLTLKPDLSAAFQTYRPHSSSNNSKSSESSPEVAIVSVTIPWRRLDPKPLTTDRFVMYESGNTQKLVSYCSVDPAAPSPSRDNITLRSDTYLSAVSYWLLWLAHVLLLFHWSFKSVFTHTVTPCVPI